MRAGGTGLHGEQGRMGDGERRCATPKANPRVGREWGAAGEEGRAQEERGRPEAGRQMGGELQSVQQGVAVVAGGKGEGGRNVEATTGRGDGRLAQEAQRGANGRIGPPPKGPDAISRECRCGGAEWGERPCRGGGGGGERGREGGSISRRRTRSLGGEASRPLSRAGWTGTGCRGLHQCNRGWRRATTGRARFDWVGCIARLCQRVGEERHDPLSAVGCQRQGRVAAGGDDVADGGANRARVEASQGGALQTLEVVQYRGA